MQYRQLGRSGLKISLHTLGTMTYGGEGFFSKTGDVQLGDAQRQIDMAVDAGVNMIDTANIYSFGKAEEIVGAALKGRSSQILVGTKVRFGMGKGPNEQGLSRYHIIEQCEASLRRLQRDRIDLYFLHEWDGLTPVEEMMEALDTLVKQGKVRYIGCSNFSGWHIMKALMAADRHNFQRFCCQQIHYTLECRDAEYELLPIALDQGLGAQVWSPLAGGLLSGKFRRNAPPPQLSRQTQGWGEPPVKSEERLYRIIDVLTKIGTAHSVSPAQVALAWLAGRPGVASIVIGARSEEQLKDNLAAAELQLKPSETALLDNVSLQPLPYPYWHQCNTAAERFSAADLVLQAQHMARRKPRM